MNNKLIRACLTCLFIIFLSTFDTATATTYNINIFNGGGASNNAIINRLTPFVAGDVLNITAPITATSAIGNIGSFALTITGNGNTLNGGAVPTFAGFTIAGAGNYSFDSTDLDRFRSTVTTAGAAITNAGNLSFTNGGFTSNSARNGAAVYNTGSATLTGDSFITNVVSSSGGAIYNNGTTMDLTSNIFTSNTATTSGGAVYNAATRLIDSTNNTFNSNIAGTGGAIYNAGTLVSSGDTFDNNSSTTGGTTSGGGAIQNASATSSITIDDGTFTNNTAVRNGGAIYNLSGTLDIANSLFDSNRADTATTAASLGGAIYSGTSSNLTIENTDFSNNYAKSTGGAIYASGATVSITGGSFTDNSSGLIGGAIYSTGTLEILSGTDFERNMTINANSDGGALYLTGITTISDATFTDNSAVRNGGAIYNNITLTGRSLAVSDTGFTGNSAVSGGAIYNAGTRTTTLTDNTFTDNTTSGSGGAIYNTGIITSSGNTFTTNTATVSGGALYNTGTATFLNSDFSGNTAGTSGGAIFNSGTLRIQADGEESLFTSNAVGAVANDLHLAGGTVYLNAGNGGSVTFDGGITSTLKANAINVNTVTGSATLTNGTVNFNGDISTATVNIAAGTTNVGKGSIANVNEDNVLFAITGGTQNFTNNTFLNGSRITLNDTTPTGSESLNVTNGTFTGTGSFAGSGGAINVTLGTSNITGSDFTGYTATTSGGAIYNDGTAANTTMTLTDDNFTGNTSASGGAIFNTGTISVNGTITGTGPSATSTSTFLNNIASTGNGGAIYNTGSVTINGVKFDNNDSNATATSTGGGAIYTATGTTTIDDSIFTSNTAQRTGGAINQASGTLTITDSLFASNTVTIATTAASMGGAVYSGAGTLTITNTDFTNNSAKSTGGAIYMLSTNSITGGTFSTNSAGIGGAIFSSGNSTISGVTFDSNNALTTFLNSGGGAIYNNVDSMAITDSTFTSNTANISTAAAAYGGAIFNQNAPMTITGTLTGSGIGATSTTTFTGNTAFTFGGAIYNNTTTAGRTLTATGTIFDNNSATSGGAVYNNAGVSTFTNDIFKNNSATTSGGAIYSAAGTVTLNGSDFFSNTAVTSGGAIHSVGTLTVGTGITFDSNTATGAGSDGGAIYATGTTSLTSDIFTNNSAVGDGGAIYSSSTNFTSTDSTFTDNGKVGAVVTTTNGGAIYNNNGIMTLTGGSFTDNASTTAGGAIYSTATTAGRTLNVSGASFSGNSSSTGGAIYNAGTRTATLTNNTFTSNTASTNGGAIYNTGVETITNSDFTSNSASVSGGAIYNASGTTTLTDSSFTSNTATTSGGAIYIAAGTVNVNATGEDVTFSGNTQGGNANDISMVAGSILNLTANSFDITLNGGVQGAGTINKLGIGDLILSSTSANNLFTGTYNNSAGNVQIQSAFFNGINNFTAGTADIQTGGSLILNSGTLADTWTNTIISNTGGTLDFNSFSHPSGGAYNQSAGTLSLNNTTGTASTFTLTSGSNVTGGNITFSGIGNTLSVATGGVLNPNVALNLTSGNNFTVSGGTATLNGTGTGTDTWAGTVNISSGTLDINSIISNGIYNQTGGTTNLDSGSIITLLNTSNLGGGSLVADGILNLSNTLTETVATAISGTGTVNKNAVGASTFTGNNSGFTGTYNQTAGLATIRNSFFSGVNNFNGGSVDVDTAGSLTLNSGDSWTTTDILTSGGVMTLDGFSHTTGGMYDQTSGTLHLNNGSYLTLNALNTISGGVVDYAGSGSILDVATGGSFSTGATLILTLNTENTFKVSGGTATLSSTDTWGGLGKVDLTSGSLTLNGITSNGIYNQSGGALSLTTGANLTLGTGSTISAGTVAYSGTGVKTLDVATGGAFLSNAAINITAGNIFKVSGGTATLNGSGIGTDVWAGTVNVTGGNLALNGITSNGIYDQTGGTTNLALGSTLTLLNTSNLGGGSLAANGTLNLANTTAETVATQITGTGIVNKNAIGTSTFTADDSGFTGTYNQTSGGVIIQNNFFNGTNNFTGASTTAEIQTGGSLTLNSGDTWTNTNISTTGGSFTLDGFSHLAGGTYNQTSGALHLNNASSLTLSTSNAISGGTVDFGGTGNLLNIATGGTFGTNTVLNLTTDNTFRVSGGTATLGNNVTWSGLGKVDLTSGSLTVDSTTAGGIYTQSGGTSNFFNSNINTSSDIVFSGGTMNLDAGSGSSTNLNSVINSTSLANVINLNNTGSGTINVNNNINNSTINFYNGTMALANESYINGNNLGIYGGTINTQNSLIGTMALNNVVFGGNANWLMDVDLANVIGDQITSANSATGAGILNISGINLFSDANAVNTSVIVADTNTKNNVSTSVSSVNGALFTYGVSYNGAGTNGVLNFVKTGVSPNAVTSDVSQTSTFLLQTAIDRQFFGNVDSFMSFPLAARESTICCALAHDPTSGYTGGACPLSGNGTFSPIYSCDLNKGIWVKDFVSFENIPLQNGPNVSTVEYGTLIGADAPLRHLGHGIVGNTSAFVGYLGSNQNYDSVGVSQNGALVGLAENMVYKNTFLTLMASVGSSLGNAVTPWGTDHFSSLFAGCAAKGGYNFEFKDGEYILQPNLMLAYTFTNTPNYTTASGLNMSSKPLNAMQIAPGVRFIKNMRHEKGQVYLVANMVFNVMDKTNFTANDVQLPQLAIAPYIEYGIGYQRVWKERFTGFFQTLFRGGGRNGIALQFGLRWAI